MCDFINNSIEEAGKPQIIDPSTLPYEVVTPIFEQRWQPPDTVASFDAEIWHWHNKLRADPRSILPTLETMKSHFQDKNYNKGQKMT